MREDDVLSDESERLAEMVLHPVEIAVVEEIRTVHQHFQRGTADLVDQPASLLGRVDDVVVLGFERQLDPGSLGGFGGHPQLSHQISPGFVGLVVRVRAPHDVVACAGAQRDDARSEAGRQVDQADKVLEIASTTVRVGMHHVVGPVDRGDLDASRVQQLA